MVNTLSYFIDINYSLVQKPKTKTQNKNPNKIITDELFACLFSLEK